MKTSALLPLLLAALLGVHCAQADYTAEAFEDAAEEDTAPLDNSLKAGEEDLTDAAEYEAAVELPYLERERREAEEQASLTPLQRTERQAGRKRPSGSPPPGERPPKRQRTGPYRPPTPTLPSPPGTPPRSRSRSRSRSPGGR